MAVYGGGMTTKKNEPVSVPDVETVEKIHEELVEGTLPADKIQAHAVLPPEGTEIASTFVPAVGRIVHYEGADGPVAALITASSQDKDGTVSLTLFHPHGQVAKPSVKYSEKPKLGSWNVPPRS